MASSRRVDLAHVMSDVLRSSSELCTIQRIATSFDNSASRYQNDHSAGWDEGGAPRAGHHPRRALGACATASICALASRGQAHSEHHDTGEVRHTLIARAGPARSLAWLARFRLRRDASAISQSRIPGTVRHLEFRRACDQQGLRPGDTGLPNQGPCAA
jgi:hypothetical protein